MQVAERDIWQRKGWNWFNCPKKVAGEDEPQRALVQIDFTTPSSATSYQVRVVIDHRIETEYSSHEAETYAYPQYRSTLLTDGASS